MVRYAVLGPLEAENERGSIDLKGLRHRAVLARLLIARGRAVPVTRLIDDLWEVAPDGARGALQTFVGALRGALEPDRPPRSPARLLVTASTGYALHASSEAVDAWRFEAAVTGSAELLAAGQAGEVRARLEAALDLWRGPAYAEFADHGWARAEAARLDEFRRLAVERRAEALLALGLAAEAVPDLEAHVAAQPLREDGWRLLALALFRSGRQSDALAALRRARDLLRDELGLEPGERLRQLEADILAQAPHLSAPAAQGRGGMAHVSAPGAHGRGGVPHPPTPDRVDAPFVGRAGELAELEGVAAATVAAARPRLALVSGAAGAGKTALAAALTRRLELAGWTTAWGTSPERGGAPAAWPWTQLAGLPEAREPATARFERQRAIGAFVAGIAERAPLLLVFDDLHWADEETLALLTALAVDSGLGPVLLVGTYRSDEITPGLGEALGRAARAEPARIYLPGLAEPEVRALVEALTEREIAPGHARTIHTRSGGNPFFVRELARLWAAEGDAALDAVPAGVRDVIRQRLARLPEPARTHLRQAAVIGQEVEVELLTRLAGDEDQVLSSVESALLAGFVVERDAGRLRFAHALVHDALYDDVPRARRAAWHAAVAGEIEALRPTDVEAIAHHLLRAENRASSARTAHFAGAAAQRAERRFAPHEAARLWRETVAAFDRDEHPDARGRLEAVMGMVRSLAVTGDLRQAREHRAEAIVAAEALGDPALTAEVIGAFEVPALWTTSDDEALSASVVAAAERTLSALPADHDAERARLLATIALERRADASQRGAEAAQEAEALARRLGDPALEALALNGRFLQTFQRAGLAPERGRIGEALVELAAAHGLVTFEVLGHLILVGARAALADLAAADRHAATADALAERYDLPVVGVFTDWYAALRLAVAGRTEEAAAAYRAAAARLSGTGMSGLEDGILPLALLSLGAPPRDADWGPYAPWAPAYEGTIPDSPRDLLFEARTVLHATMAIDARDRPRMERLHQQLLPAADELAGAGSGLLTLGPVALYLARLAAALDRPEQAAEHYRRALHVAERAQAPQWVTAAEAGRA